MIYSKDYQYISKRTRQIWANVWMLLTPVILFLMMEHINNPYGNLNIGLKYWIINVLCCHSMCLQNDRKQDENKDQDLFGRFNSCIDFKRLYGN